MFSTMHLYCIAYHVTLQKILLHYITMTCCNVFGQLHIDLGFAEQAMPGHASEGRGVEVGVGVGVAEGGVGMMRGSLQVQWTPMASVTRGKQPKWKP